MVSFTRQRSRDLGSYSVTQQNWTNADAGKCMQGPWALLTDQTVSKALVNAELILDQFPCGPYHEGDFKIGSVVRQKISQTTTPYTLWFPHWNCSNNTGMTKGTGYYCFPLRFSPAGVLSPTYPAFVTNDINNHCRSALASANSPDVGIGETLAEWKAGLGMLRSPMKGLRDLFGKATRKPGGGALRNLSDASSAWLEYRYGWTPLVSTILDILKGLPKYETERIYDAKASTTTETTVTLAPVFTRFPNSGTGAFHEGYVTTKVRKTGRVYFTVVDATSYNRLKMGLDVLYLPQLMYELTRLSYAVDWWLNLGDYIAALVPNPYINVLGYTYAEKITTTSVSSLKNCAYYDYSIGNYRYGSADGNFTEVKETYHREVVTPNVSALPTLDLDFRSIKHAIDALGLIVQSVPKQYGNKRRPYRS